MAAVWAPCRDAPWGLPSPPVATRRNVVALGAPTQRYAPLAVNTLAQVMMDDGAPSSSKVAAATTILRFGREGIELDDLAARVEALEQSAPTALF